MAKSAISVPATYKQALTLVFVLTIICLGISVCVAAFDHGKREHLSQVFEMTSTLTKTGFGAIVGLIEGKASE